MTSQSFKALRLLICFVFCFLLFSIISSAVAATTANPAAMVLKNDFVQLEFEKDHLGLSAMIDLKTGKNHINPTEREHLLWELLLRRGMQTQSLTSIQNPVTSFKLSTLPSGDLQATIVWDGITFWREKNAITVTVTVDLPKESGIALWKISVDNRSDFWGLWEVHFPYFSGAMKAPDYTVARPSRDWGQLYEGVTEVEVERYPSSQWPVQMMSAYTERNGIFLAAYDPESWLKSYRCEPGKVFYFITYPKDMGVAGSDFQQNWSFAIGVYQGQWMEACKIYRKWAMTAPWMKKGKLSRRPGVPQAIKDIGLWMMTGWEFQGATGTPTQMDQPLLNAQKFFGVPLGMHWYNWHQIKFDNEYPHYFPTKPGFKERVAHLKANGILVMPYINSRLWDYDLPDYPLKWALKDYLGLPVLEIYGTTSARLTAMCPYTDFWANKVASITDSLTGYYGVNAIYLDQGGSTPRECFDPSHGHPVGGGTMWVEGRRRILDKVREVCHSNGRDAAMTMEHFNEPYIDNMDGFLIWVKRNDKEVPMNTGIYSGCTIFWSSPAWLNQGDRSFVMVQGRDFLWGTQNGWMGLELFEPKHKAKVEYLKRIGEYRVLGRKFLTYGELMNLIEPTNEVPTVTECWPNHQGVLKNGTLPSAMGAVWQAENGNLGIFMVNFLEKENPFEFTINPADYGLTIQNGQRYQVANLQPEGSTLENGYKEGSIVRKEVLKPWEIKALEIYKVNY